MTLPSAILFPQALLPLYIFEPRYRQMLTDMLRSSRMFIVAMQKPGCSREIPCRVAGLGLIRASVGHNDGTSHLILQGLTRVKLGETIKYKPYRLQCVSPLTTPTVDNVHMDALLAKVYELVERRLSLGDVPFPTHVFQKDPQSGALKSASSQVDTVGPIIEYLESLNDPEQVADMVACSLLQGAVEKQIILETVDLQQRLKHLIHFLMIEIDQRQQKKKLE